MSRPPVPVGNVAPAGRALPGDPFGRGPSPSVDRPQRRRRVTGQQLVQLIGSAAASLCLVGLLFWVTGVSGPIGFGVLACVVFLTIYAIVCWRAYGVLLMKDRLATVVVWIGALLAMIPLAAVILYVIVKGAYVALAHFPHFFTADMSGLSADAPTSAVGAGAAIVGTVEQVGIAAAISVPLGILTATYLADSRSLYARIVSYVVDAMTGAPAIIAGLFVYLFWVTPRGHSGKSGFAAGMALAVMMLPIVTRASQEVVSIVPGSLREAALALGAPQWRVLVRIVLPTARAGLMTAVILGTARIAGETAPILFNAGGNKSYNWNPFSGQQDNLPLRIYDLIFQPGINVVKDAWGVSFVLVLMVLILFVLARVAGSSRPGRHLIPRLRRAHPQ
ncbi:MAG TPA: phosphate ABC transporter permease PstA [Acidimicrobiales bacterium]|jgi:phosphate transport system permease protein|nr:phosphate ABC transporter permease PstA [Acidimicrobiales bacterium]